MLFLFRNNSRPRSSFLYEYCKRNASFNGVRYYTQFSVSQQNSSSKPRVTTNYSLVTLVPSASLKIRVVRTWRQRSDLAFMTPQVTDVRPHNLTLMFVRTYSWLQRRPKSPRLPFLCHSAEADSAEATLYLNLGIPLEAWRKRESSAENIFKAR